MIIALSTSSPVASVAILEDDGRVRRESSRVAPQAASGACLAMLEALLDEPLSKATLILADLGPGSFTGVRVGVTLAKVLAFMAGASCGGASSFDLVNREGDVAIPSRRGEYFIRKPGHEPFRTTERPATTLVGFGPWFEEGEAVYPLAARFSALVTSLTTLAPEELLPSYLMEPSISLPKSPFGRVVSG